MTFYTYSYLTTQHSSWQYVRIGVLIALLIVFIGLFVYYLRHQWNVKYKDLSIITATVLFLVLGLQINSLVSLQSSSKQTGEITATIQQVAKQLKVKPAKISINATSIGSDLLVKSPKGYYRLVYSSDGATFVLEAVTLESPQVKLVKE
ncbi:DUF3290 domain-containing protein [Levilactobacillus tujiorum]|uniref:DUF3290 domain-containing protein n=1 Tax=Levilactobacillus tujiorum TaxID=2912243 RepID=UPI0014569928|nr:DUF3290 domain-containing protein [Levilactobacillus tujiorum]NLR31744.1 DUF3290 domain-containing protein [Levilactobacillus tujiorum]